MRNDDKLPSMEIIQERIHEGDTIKNYKVMCELLEIPVLGGRGRNYQIEYLKRCFSYEREGHSYIITQVFDEVEPVEKALRSDAVYQRVIEIILLEYLRSRRGKSCIHTYREWFRILGMVNDRYSHDVNQTDIKHVEIRNPVILATGSKQGKTAAEINRLAINYNYNAFFSRTTGYFSSVLKRIFTSLQNNRHIIFFSKKYIIYDGHDQHIAENEELKQVIDAYQEAMETVGIKEEYQIFQRSQVNVKRFYSSVNAHLRRKLHFQYEHSGVFPAIEVVYGDNKYLDQQIEYSYEKLQEVLDARSELNCKCYEWCNKNALTYYNRLSGDLKDWYSLDAQRDMADYYILPEEPLLEDIADSSDAS